MLLGADDAIVGGFVAKSVTAPIGMGIAERIGVSPTLFDEMVEDGRMPKPVRINGRTVWDRVRLDEAFAGLSDEDREGSPWEDVAL